MRTGKSTARAQAFTPWNSCPSALSPPLYNFVSGWLTMEELPPFFVHAEHFTELLPPQAFSVLESDTAYSCRRREPHRCHQAHSHLVCTAAVLAILRTALLDVLDILADNVARIFVVDE